MVFFKPLFRLGMLLALTALMCSALVEFLQINPLCSLGVLCVGTLAILLAVDAI